MLRLLCIMYTDISQVNKMFQNSSSALAAMPRPPMYPGQAQYFGLGQGSDGKMPCALTFTGKTFFVKLIRFYDILNIM